MNEELEFYKNIININKKFKYGINMISILKKKIMEQKEKSQKEEFKYFQNYMKEHIIKIQI
jgi:hypothetical protein